MNSTHFQSELSTWRLVFAALLALLPAAPLGAAFYYVAPDGQDANPGTLAAPIGTVQRAQKAAAPGDTVYIRGGTYEMTETQLARSQRGRAYKAGGFHANHHLGGLDWLNNTAYRNATKYNMLYRIADNSTDVPGYGHKMKNNLGYKGRTELSNLNPAASEVGGNYFNLPVEIGDKDFASLKEADLTQFRQANGDLPEIAFLHLAPGSGAIDKGTDVGLPFTGPAPDLGAFETKPEKAQK